MNQECLDGALESPEKFLLYTKNNYKNQERNIGIQSSLI
ncbi:hypothetical protein [uncultured Gammaproteobacteria bacterium]|nr:hypothetical protein [uncultured Gammaproteobacteria bacterium]